APCEVRGAVSDRDPAPIVPDDRLPLDAGAILPWAKGDRRLIQDMLAGLQKTFGIDPAVPFAKLPKKQRDIVLYGAPGRKSLDSPASGLARDKAKRNKKAPADPFGADFEGAIPNLRRRFEEGSWTDQEALEPLRALQTC